MKSFLALIPAALVAVLAACGSGGATNNATATLEAPPSSSAVTPTSTTPPATVQPVPARDESYSYYGEHDAVITVRCVQTENAGSLTYSVSGKNLGTGTFSLGKPGMGGEQPIGDDGSIGDTSGPSMPNVTVDTIASLTVDAANYKNTLKFRGCEPI